MKVGSIAIWLPVVLTVIGASYTMINYVTKLDANIQELYKASGTLVNADSTMQSDVQAQIQMVNARIDAVEKTANNGITNLNSRYQDAREQMTQEIANIVVRIGEIDAMGRAMQAQFGTFASEAEVRAMESTFYKLDNQLEQFKYDLKEFDRQLNGGY